VSALSSKWQFDRVRHRLREWLASTVVWQTDDSIPLADRWQSAPKWVLIVGREHYSERRASYPVRGWFDLHRILRLESRGSDNTLSVIHPLIDDRRSVTFYQLRPELNLSESGYLFWIPETVLLERSMASPSELATVTRSGLTYFLAPGVASQPAGGLLRSIELFAMAAGRSSENAITLNDTGAIRERLWNGLATLPLSYWARLLSPVFTARVKLFAKPVAAISAVTLVAYLALSSAYLWGMTAFREWQLAKMGDEAGVLVEKQRRIDLLSDEQKAIVKILDERLAATGVWRLASTAWEKEGWAEGVSVANGEVTIRGIAPSATDVLRRMSAVKGIVGARFDAPVRDVDGKQQFVIRAQLTAEFGRD
jgi:hypothetical protein